MLNLYHLKYFYDAATTGSLLGAGQMNHVSSQAISQGIQALETNLGVKLLLHKKNRFQLTQHGEKLREEAVGLLKSAEAISGKVKKESGKPSGIIEIAASGSVFHYLLNPVLGKFSALHSDVVIKSAHLPSAKIIDYLTRGQIAMGVVLFDSRLGAYETVEILRGDFVLIAKKQIDLAKANFFIKEEGPESWDLEKKYFKEFQKYPYVKGILGSWESVLDYVELGLGYGLVPDFIKQRSAVKYCEPAVDLELSHYQIVVAFKSRQHLPEVCEEFLTFLEGEVKI